VVLGIAVDVGEEQPVRLTLFVPHPTSSKKGDEAGQPDEGWVVAREAATISDALALIRQASARRLVFHHLRVLLIGEEYARTVGVADLLDLLANNVEIRKTVRPFVVEGRAQTVFETIPQLRSIQPNNLVGIIHAFRAVDWRLRHVLVARASVTHTMWMHAIRVIERPARVPGDPNTTVTLSGAALFRRDFLVQIVHPWENQVLTWFLAEPKGSTITAPCPNPDTGTLSVQVLWGRARIRPRLVGQQPAFLVEADARVNLDRSECDVTALREGEGRLELERAIEEDLRHRIQGFIDILQETGTDPVGFGKAMQLAYPAYYHTLGDEWLEVWKKAPVQVTTRASLIGAGLMTNKATKTHRELLEQK